MHEKHCLRRFLVLLKRSNLMKSLKGALCFLQIIDYIEIVILCRETQRINLILTEIDNFWKCVFFCSMNF